MRRVLQALVIAAALASVVVPAGPGAVAQEAGASPAEVDRTLDLSEWEKVADAAEDSIDAGRASSTALEQLREKITVWRSDFTVAQSANQSRIETVRAQIAALGPAPAEGATEAPEVAARRAELGSQLQALQAPGIAATEAFSRADSIVRQIDSTIRERQADALLHLSPSPVNPVNWPAGLAVLTQGMATLWHETRDAWNNPARRVELRNNLPAILLYLAIAGLLMARVPGFLERLVIRLQDRSSARARYIAATVISLGQVVLPVVGMFLLVRAISVSGMTGMRSGALFNALPSAALVFFGARWLGSWLFRSQGQRDDEEVFSILADRRAEGRFHVTMLGLLSAVEVFRQAFITEVRPPLSQAAQSVWAFPLSAVIALVLFRLGMLLRKGARDRTTQAEARAFHIRMLGIVGTALVAVSVVGPLLGMVGYVAAANALVWPTVYSLGLLGLLIILQRVAADLYLVVTRSKEEGRDALIPVLISFALTLAALPLFALIWGARTADLTEAWTRFSSGVALGETRISPLSFLTFALVFAAGYTATRFVQGALRSSVLPKTKIDKGGQNALVSGLGYIGIMVAALIAITAAGIDLSSLAIVAGALSLGIGFGLQNIVQNFVSGIILLIERPISEGDWIEVGGQQGIVKAISVRSTRIETFDRTDVIVPNADLVSGVVTNWTRFNLTGRVVVPVSVAYGSDTRHVEAILREIAEAHPMVVLNPPPVVAFVGFGADGLNFEIRAILRDVNFKGAAHSDMNHEIARRLHEARIDIPFPQRDFWIRNPEALARAFAQETRLGRDETGAPPPAATEAPGTPAE